MLRKPLEANPKPTTPNTHSTEMTEEAPQGAPTASNHHSNTSQELAFTTSTPALSNNSLFASKADQKIFEINEERFLLKKFLNIRLFPTLLTAIIDNDHATVIELLNKNPDLLLIDPSDAGKTNVDTSNNFVIQSKYTHVKFYAEDALTMAVKRRQLEMIKLLLPYYEQLGEEGQAVKTKALAAWKTYNVQKNAVGKNEIVIPDAYMQDANKLVNLFIKERFANGTSYDLRILSQADFDRLLPHEKNTPCLIRGVNNQYALWGEKENQWQLTQLDQRFNFPREWAGQQTVAVHYYQEIYPTLKQGHQHALLSQEAEEKLSLLFKKFIPEDAVKCDDLDPELFLLAAYRAHDNKFAQFAQNPFSPLAWARRDAFCVRVIGLIQSMLSPETAMLFCEGFHNTARAWLEATAAGKKIEFSEHANNLKFKVDASEVAFYRSSRESRVGLGFDFLSLTYLAAGDRVAALESTTWLSQFNLFVEQKLQTFAACCSQSHHAPVRNRAPRV